MRLLFVIDGFDPRMGGNVEAIRQFATEAVLQGHAITVVGASGPAPADPQRWPGVELVQTGRPRGRIAFSAGLRSWMQANYQGFEGIIVNGVWRYADLCSWHVLRRRQVRYYLFTHGGVAASRLDLRAKRWAKTLYWRVIQHRVVRDATKVFFTSNDELVGSRSLFAPYSCNPAIVPLGTNFPEGEPDADRACFFSRFPSLEGARCLLFLGRLHHQKGVDVLVQAFAEIADQDRRLRLVIVGPDPDTAQIDIKQLARRSSIADRVVCTGALFGREKVGALRSAEVCVLPSRFDSFNLAAIESLACGTPVIVSSSVPVWRTITAANAGLVCEPSVMGVRSVLTFWLGLTNSCRDDYRRRAVEAFHLHYDIRDVTRSFLGALKCAGETLPTKN